MNELLNGKTGRRFFIKQSFGLTFFPYLIASTPARKAKIRFGLVADLHYAAKQNHGYRYYEHSRRKLKEAVNIFNKSNLDFIVELGDFKDQGIKPDKEQTISFLKEIEEIFQTFNGPVYHVLGNHDMDSISKTDFLRHIKNHGQVETKNFYSFIYRKIKFIVLDANYNEDGSDYCCGNFNWKKAIIPEEQVAWLTSELSGTQIPVVIFVHQLLDSFSDVSADVCVRNASEIRTILENSRKILAVFQGHHHIGNYSFHNGINYYTLRAMVENPFPQNSYAIVEVDRNLNIRVEGKGSAESKFLVRQKAK